MLAPLRILKPIRIPLIAAAAILVVAGPAGAFVPQPGDRLLWQNAQTGHCMGVAGGDVTPGRAIISWPCNGNSDQTWIADQVGGPYADGSADFVLRDGTNHNKCLSIGGMVLKERQPLVIWDCKPLSAYSDQVWRLSHSSEAGIDCTVFTSREGLTYGQTWHMILKWGDPTQLGSPIVLNGGGGIPTEDWCPAPAPAP